MSVSRLVACVATACALTLEGGSARAERTAAQSDIYSTPILFLQGTVVGSDGARAQWTSTYQPANGPGQITMTMQADPTTCRVWTYRPPAGSSPQVTWRVGMRPVKTVDEQAVVDVTWSRAIGNPDDPEVEQALRLVLTPGNPTPIDLLAAPSGGASKCSRFILELGAQIGENSGQSVLHYDMWLIVRDRDGRERVQRQQTNGVHAGEMPFIFAPSYYRSDGTTSETREPGGISSAITGKVRGRVRSDGSIALTLDTMRNGSIVDGHGSVGWTGRKEISVRPGETIEVTIPPPGERNPELDPDGRLRADEIAQVVKGQSAAIRITTTRLL